MEAINQLEHSYFLLKSGGGDYHECVQWAVDRLRQNEEGDDEDIVLLAASSARSEVLAFAEHVVERYSGYQALDPQLAAAGQLESLRFSPAHDRHHAISHERSGVACGQAAPLRTMAHADTRYGPPGRDRSSDSRGVFDLGQLRHGRKRWRWWCAEILPCLA